MPPTTKAKPTASAKRRHLTREEAYKRQRAQQAADRQAKLLAAQHARLAVGAAAADDAEAPDTRRVSKRVEKKSKRSAKLAAIVDDPHPFRYKSLADRLASVRIDRARGLTRRHALAGLDPYGRAAAAAAATASTSKAIAGPGQVDDESDGYDSEEGDEALHAATSFGTALAAWRELNLSLPFTDFLYRITPLSLSLPLLLHNRPTIVASLCKLLHDRSPTAHFAYEPALDLIPRLALDLGSEFLPAYPELLAATLSASSVTKVECGSDERLAATIVERSFESAAATLKCVAPLITKGKARANPEEREQDWVAVTWDIVRPYLGWVDWDDGELLTPKAGLNGEVEEDEQGEDSEAEGEAPDDDQGEDEVGNLPEDQQDVQGDAADDVPSPPRPARLRTRKVPEYTRRFASEALADLVRKARASQLSQLAQMMLRDAASARGHARRTGRGNDAARAKDLLKGVAGVWTETATSIEGQLHSQAPQLLSFILKAEADDEDSVEARREVGRFLFTSLVHGSQARNLVAIYELVLALADERLQRLEHGQADAAALEEAIVWLSYLVGTRKGTRVADEIKPNLFGFLLRLARVSRTPAFPLSRTGLRAQLVALLSVAMPVGRIQDLLGAGQKLLDVLGDSEQSEPMSAAFCGLVASLASPALAWPGFGQYVLPTVLKHAGEALVSGEAVGTSNGGGDGSSQDLRRDVALHLCAQLCRLGQLRGPGATGVISTGAENVMVIRWRRNAAVAVESVLRCLSKASALPASQLEPCTTAVVLAPLLSHAADRLLESLVQAAARIRDARLHLQGQAGDAGSSHDAVALLGPLLDSIAQLLPAASPALVEACTKELIERASLKRLITLSPGRTKLLQGLVALCEAADTHLTPLGVAFVKPHEMMASLGRDLLCADPAARLAAAKLLAAAERHNSVGRGAKRADEGIYSRMADIESLPLAVENIRDRNVRVRALAREALKLAAPETGIPSARHDVVAYLVSTLKLPLRPLWEETRKALVELGASLGDEIWAVAFEELRTYSWGASGSAKGAGDADSPSADDDEEEDDEEGTSGELDKHFEDPQLERKLAAIRRCVQRADPASRFFLTDVLREQPRGLAHRGRREPVALLYAEQILKLFAMLPAVVEKHNAPFVALFREQIISEEVDSMPAQDGAQDLVEAGPDAQRAKPAKLTLAERRSRLYAYLEVFAKFSNPKALSGSEEIHAFFLHLCAKGDGRSQKLGLDCVLTWKEPSQLSYADRLRALLEPSRFREELLSFDFSVEGEGLQPDHRAGLMPLLVRLLYGQIVSKRGRGTSGAGQATRRAAILSAFGSRCTVEELQTFVELMLQPFADQKTWNGDRRVFVLSGHAPVASPHKQAGFLSLLADAIKHLGRVIAPLWPDLIAATINIAHHASRAVDAGGADVPVATLRALRQTALRRLGDFFRQPVHGAAFDWEPFLPALFSSLIGPRLALLPAENAQGASALLLLFEVWSTHPDLAPLLFSHDERLVPQLYACLAQPTVKPSVVGLVLGVVERVAAFVDQDASHAETVREGMLERFMPALLAGLLPLLRRLSSPQPGAGQQRSRDDQLRRGLRLLAEVCQYVRGSDDATAVLELFSTLLRKSNHVVPEAQKADVLAVCRRLLLLSPLFRDPTSDLFRSQLDVLASLLASMRSKHARRNLVELIREFARVDETLVRVGDWLVELEAMSAKRVEEPDFERRLSAFDEVNARVAELSLDEWRMLAPDMLFYLQDAEELAFRSNAGMALRALVQRVAEEPGQQGAIVRGEESAVTPSALRSLFTRTVLSGLRRSLRSKSEQVRRETLSVLGCCVEKVRGVVLLDEMRPLLANGDEEANFFNNVHHIQSHRRGRALRRLADHADAGSFSSRTLASVLVPLVATFLQPAAAGGEASSRVGSKGRASKTAAAASTVTPDHALVNDAVACLGRLARHLEWAAYNAALWRLLRAANEAGDGQRVFVRAALGVLESFHFNMDVSVTKSSIDAVSSGGEAEDGKGDEDGEDDGQADEGAADAAAATSVATAQKVADAVTGRLLPALMGFLEQKEGAEDATRLPVAVGIVTVTKGLAPHVREVHITKLLVTLANVLKSRSQDTRDLARETLAKVQLSLGAAYLPKTVRELRRILTRGPQLAVLAYTVHHVLVYMLNAGMVRELDEGVEDMVHVAVEDVFGHTAEDRDASEYTGKVKEQRGNKSLDTFERLAQVVRPNKLAVLLQPLRDLLSETESLRVLKAADDCLRRIAAGINANDQFDAATFLVLCYSLIRETSALAKGGRSETQTKAGKRRNGGNGLSDYHFTAVLLKRSQVEQGAKRDHWSHNSHRFVALGLDLLVAAMRRGRFDFGDAQVLARLDPLVEVVGNTLFSPHTSVLASGLKASAALVRCPLPALERSLPVFIKHMLSMAERQGGAQSDLAQAAIKGLTTILREQKRAEFKESQIARMLAMVTADLEEHGAQGVLFALLRAVLGRRFVVSEVYDVMDKVAELLVTSQSASSREVARATYLQFLLDYPQGKARLRNQLHFLVKNLGYVFESGRLSVLELLHAICDKFSEDVVSEYAELIFMGLVMRLANDDSAACREKSAALLRKILGIVQAEQRTRLLTLTHSWAEQTQKPALRRVAMQVYMLFLDHATSDDAAEPAPASWLGRALTAAQAIMREAAEEMDEVAGDELKLVALQQMGLDLDWQLAYQALQFCSQVYPRASPQQRSDMARLGARHLLLYPHAWVRAASGRLLGTAFASSEVRAPHLGPRSDSELLGRASLVEIAKKLCLQLRTSGLDEPASNQIVKNLLFVGRCFALVQPPAGGAAAASRRQKDAADGDEEGADVGEDGNDDHGVVDADSDSDSDSEQEAGDKGSEKDETDEARAKSLENPLGWLFTKLSHQARATNLARADAAPDTTVPAAVLKWFAAMASQLEAERLRDFLPHILGPILRITEDEALKDGAIEELKQLALEVQEHVSRLVGAGQFATAYSAARSRVAQRRRERRTARLMQGIQQPEAAAKHKAKRNQRKHDSRKRKAGAFAERKERIKSMKRSRA